jgi:hypothetical protein
MRYWVAQDLSAEHQSDLGFAMDLVRGAVSVITRNPFPLPGDHCLACPTRACRPDEMMRPANNAALIQSAGTTQARCSVA